MYVLFHAGSCGEGNVHADVGAAVDARAAFENLFKK